jgi:tungstate transport system substrate-binding protein
MKLKSRKIWYLIVITLLSLALIAGCTAAETDKEPVPSKELKLATTTSTYDSGLLDELTSVFGEKYGYQVSIISQGTGAALETGKRGDCDVLLVHAKSLELELVEQGYFVGRHDVMYNDFVIVGPEADPADIVSGQDVVVALAKIAESEAVFVSRGDDSGTHKKEMALWKQADLDPSGEWYRSVGQGMGDTLRMAGEMQGYTLVDRGTWIAMREAVDLKTVLEGDSVLFNQYGVMAVNPKNHLHVDHEGAKKFIDFMISEAGQNLIADFKKDGEQLFVPNASP